MKKMLINANQQEEVRIALVNKEWLYDLYIENFNNNKKKSDIYKGKITNIEISLEAVFVDYGYEKHGFLPIKEISDEYLDKNIFNINNKLSIKNCIKEGQDILVQISKEERFNKGAVLTTYISLAGSYLILIPNNSKSFGISKRINRENRKILKEIIKKLNFPNNMGIIIRTSGSEKNIEDLQNDLDLRLKHWELIKELYNERKSPSLIYKENNLITKIFRDYLTQDIDEIIIDNKNFINESKKCLIELGRQDFKDKIKIHSINSPLFSYYKIESQIESAFKRNVRLPSGGSITIDSTEALTAIDINSYKYTKGIDIEETAYNTNLESANEIARQLRLRDLGGLIIIDFIDMSNKKNCIEIENYFKKCTYYDRAKIRFGNISKFGLLEISRQRLNTSLNESNYYICPRCKGNGFIRNHKSLSLLILRLIEEESLKDNIQEIHVIVPISIGTYLLNEKRFIINEIENRKNKEIRIVIIPNNKIKTPNYILVKIKNKEETSIISYLLPKIHDKNINYNKKYKYLNKLPNFYSNNNNFENYDNKIYNIYNILKLIVKFKINLIKFIINKINEYLLRLYNTLFGKFINFKIKNNYNKKKFNFKYNNFFKKKNKKSYIRNYKFKKNKI